MMIIRALLSCFGAKPRRCRCSCAARRGDCAHAPAGWAASIDGIDAFVEIAGAKPEQPDAPVIPEAVRKQYQKVIVGDVAITQQGVCITSDVAVLGNVRITAGGTCITGNVLVFGDVFIDGFDGKTVNGTCVTGSAIVLVRVLGAWK
jgi:hypothetical protein